MDETIVNKLIDNTKAQQNQQATSKSGSVITETAPHKVLKRTPPLMDAELQISHQAGSYPINRSADLCHTLTAEVNIGGIEAFVLFDSRAETDALSLDLIWACNFPLLKLPNPMVLQMGTKGSRSCMYYGTNIKVSVHGIAKMHYFNVVNIDCYDAILGAPWLNTTDAILNFRNHMVSLLSRDIRTFDVLTEWVFHSVRHKACLRKYSDKVAHTTMSTLVNK